MHQNMDTSSSMFLFLITIVVLFSSSSGTKFVIATKDHQTTLNSYRRELVQTIKDDFLNPPITAYPTNPAVTNPVTTTAPPQTPTTATPATLTPTPVTFPVTDPILNPPTLPITNPAITPVVGPPLTTNPATTPVVGPPLGTNPATTPVVGPPVITNPATTPVLGPPLTTNPVTTPVVAPPATTTSAPAVPGQSWCVARGGLPDNALQAALDYACGLGGADCSAIQEGASCYNPNSMLNHASYAFNSYYQRNPVQTSCDFGGTAMVTNVNPGSGSCIFTTWSSSSASPTVPSPVTTTPTPTPTTESSSGAPPSGLGFTPPAALNGGGPPTLGGSITGFGESPFAGNSSSVSTSTGLKPFIGCIIVVTSIITRRIVSDI